MADTAHQWSGPVIMDLDPMEEDTKEVIVCDTRRGLIYGADGNAK